MFTPRMTKVSLSHLRFEESPFSAPPSRLREIRLVDGVGNSRVVLAPEDCVQGDWLNPGGVVYVLFRPLGALTDGKRRPIWVPDSMLQRAAKHEKVLFTMRPTPARGETLESRIDAAIDRAWWDELYQTHTPLPYLIYAALMPPDDNAVEGGRY